MLVSTAGFGGGTEDESFADGVEETSDFEVEAFC